MMRKRSLYAPKQVSAGAKHTAGLTAKRGRELAEKMDGFATLIPASDIVEKLRLVKSPAEIEYVRKAAEIGDACYLKALDVIAPGVSEGEILAVALQRQDRRRLQN